MTPTTLGEAALAGILAGYAIAIPVGAIAALLITLGAQHGARTAAGGALGAATVDGVYATVAVVAGAAVAPLIALIEEPLRWISVAVLVVLAIMIALPGLRRARTPATPPPGDADARLAAPAPAPGTTTRTRRTPALRLFLTVGGLTLVNPVTVVYFAALVGSSTLAADAGWGARAVFVLAAFAASLSWQLLLTTAGALVGRALTGPVGARVTALLGGALILVLAVRAALGA
ncbi:LysE family transporter [Microcella alkalica]|uniref:LysE family transporter n=1 Tax=Microcella alkalica TaxID=355930 RepID=UPI00145F5A5A|nr:LysE family transporter [Microcella alkalica]